MEKSNNFWTTCEGKVKEEIYLDLSQILGKPKKEKEKACLKDISKKIASYYKKSDWKSATKNPFLMVNHVSEIRQRVRGGPNAGQISYDLKLVIPKNEINHFKAYQENLPPEKWKQIEKLAILDRELVFYYQKWINHAHLLDFKTLENTENLGENEPKTA